MRLACLGQRFDRIDSASTRRHHSCRARLIDSLKSRRLDAFARLLGDAIQGNRTLFMRCDEVGAAWRWIDPICAAWDADLDGPRPHAARTWRPSAAASLIARDGCEWHDEV